MGILSEARDAFLSVDKDLGNSLRSWFHPHNFYIRRCSLALECCTGLLCVCVGSSSSALVSSSVDCRSIITAGMPSPVLAARIPNDLDEDCETTEAQLLPGLLTRVLDGVVGAFTD